MQPSAWRPERLRAAGVLPWTSHSGRQGGITRVDGGMHPEDEHGELHCPRLRAEVAYEFAV